MNQPPLECNRSAMDDDGLVARVAAGDDTALRELFSRHAPWLAARLRAALPAAGGSSRFFRYLNRPLRTHWCRRAGIMEGDE